MLYRICLVYAEHEMGDIYITKVNLKTTYIHISTIQFAMKHIVATMIWSLETFRLLLGMLYFRYTLQTIVLLFVGLYFGFRLFIFLSILAR